MERETQDANGKSCSAVQRLAQKQFLESVGRCGNDKRRAQIPGEPMGCENIWEEESIRAQREVTTEVVTDCAKREHQRFSLGLGYTSGSDNEWSACETRWSTG